MAAKLIWHSDTCPPKPVNGTSDRAMRAMPKTLRGTEGVGVVEDARQHQPDADDRGGGHRRGAPGLRGMSSREIEVEWVRSCGFGSTSSTTKSTTTGITNRNEMR